MSVLAAPSSRSSSSPRRVSASGGGASPDGFGYDSRNPAWIRGGVEVAGAIHWSEPEILLSDRDPGQRISYADVVEDDGDLFITATEKTQARVHRIDPDLIAGLFDPRRDGSGLLLDLAGPDTGADLPPLPPLEDGGLSVLCRIAPGNERTPGVLFAAHGADGQGLRVRLETDGRCRLELCGTLRAPPGGLREGCGMAMQAWDTSLPLPVEACSVAFLVDGRARVWSVLVDGRFDDGGAHRAYGWTRLQPGLSTLPHGGTASRGPALHRVLVLDRCLRSAEAIALHRRLGAAIPTA